MEQALAALGQVVLRCMSAAGDDARLMRELGRLSAALSEMMASPNGLAAPGTHASALGEWEVQTPSEVKPNHPSRSAAAFSVTATATGTGIGRVFQELPA